MKQPIFIDTDAGLDDIVAIGLLILSEKFTIKGISVVNGVASVDKGSKNLSSLLEYWNNKTLIYKGAAQGTQDSSIQFPTLDRRRANQLIPLSPFPKKSTPDTKSIKQVKQLFNTLNTPLLVFCIGPLTNVGLFIANKTIRKKVKTLAIMGGAIYANGNVKPNYLSEYNIRLDTQSAQKVIISSIPKTVIPIDATLSVPAIVTNNSATFSMKLLKEFLMWLRDYAPSTPLAATLRDIILNNANDFTNFYDPLAAAILIDPSIVSKRSYGQIQVSRKRKTYGKLTFNQKMLASNSVIFDVNPRKFYTLLKKLIQKG